MCRQVIEHDAHLGGLWIMGVDEFAHTLGEVAGRAVLGDLDPAPAAMAIKEDEQIGRAVALIFAVIAFELPGSAGIGWRTSPMSWVGLSSNRPRVALDRVLRPRD